MLIGPAARRLQGRVGLWVLWSGGARLTVALDPALILNISNVLVNVHVLGLLDIQEELLSVAPDLGPRTSLYELFDELPVFAVETEC